ncbi:hypothetical protein AB0O91_38115 [Kitasatospora sp. NPDC089797]|uniref:hypothetical protein n=1 Tax=Kitasatospora sp. NPDC089797 TaxID=3155298 RepID=UPI003424D4D0
MRPAEPSAPAGRPALSADLGRAAGPDEQVADVVGLAAARDLAAAATAVVAHHCTASFGGACGLGPARESLGLAFALLAQAAGRLRTIAGLLPQGTDGTEG